MSKKKIRVPKNVKKIPRCPLCHAVFAEQIIPSRVGDWWICSSCDTATPANRKDPYAACPRCGERREAHHADGKALMCHFCKIAIMANDPMVGRWEEVYAKGEKIMCPACDHEMRYFCTSTGYMQARCPVRICGAKIETTSPDRKAGEVTMLNSEGEKVSLPNIDRPVATPEEPGATQVGGS